MSKIKCKIANLLHTQYHPKLNKDLLPHVQSVYDSRWHAVGDFWEQLSVVWRQKLGPEKCDTCGKLASFSWYGW